MLTYVLRKLTLLPFFYSPERKFASLFFDALGRIAIGDPRQLACPSSFYFLQADRPIPRAEDINDAEIERVLIHSDIVRRRLTDFVAKIAAVLILFGTFAWCIVALMVQLVALGIVAAVR